MEKIGPSPWTELSDLEESHHVFFLNNRIWLFSKSYVPQASHNFGHYVTLKGGYSLYFDLGSKIWSQKVNFPAICEEEDAEETLFLLNSSLFLLLYSQFGGIKFQHLYRWDETKRNWNQFESFEVGSECNESATDVWKTNLIVVDQQKSEDAEGFCYLMSSNETSTILYQLSIDNNNTNAELTFVHKLFEKDPLRRLVLTVRKNDKIYWLQGVHGCGFRIEPGTLKEFDVKTKNENERKIAGQHPPFSYNGSRCTKVVSSGKWIHATGDTAVGMTGVKFCGQIWAMNFDGPQVLWEKLDFEVPECDDIITLVAVTDDSVLYVIDSKNGVMMHSL